MPTTTLDEHLAQFIGHPKPFSDDELATVDPILTLENVTSIAGIERLVHLEELRLFASIQRTPHPAEPKTGPPLGTMGRGESTKGPRTDQENVGSRY